MSIPYLANLCRQIYDDDVLEEGFHHYYLHSENIIVIAGTNSKKDWFKYNLDIFPLRPFHLGLGKVAQELYNYYRPYLNKDTIITGHSAGSIISIALAELAGCNSITFSGCLLKASNYRLTQKHLMISNKIDFMNLIVGDDPNLTRIYLPGIGHSISSIGLEKIGDDEFYFG